MPPRRPSRLDAVAVSCYPNTMRRPILTIGPREAALVVCTAALVLLVYLEGWIWPLKAAAVVIPLSLLAG
jgi:hypothetical protein